ncbi:hypothetical protein [uncultured Sphingomonas sp.]|uniref:DUF6894 family protein n=1 Tax=uncultured Sphingomonas sp. TaxID=158754 RepID=UPI0025E1DF94|nr:hypothetical protein [uncultured Sphingomonas sp.]
MQRYFFNVQDRHGYLVDPDGIEHADAAMARHTAVAFGRSLLGEDLAQGFIDLNGSIEVMNDAGTVVHRVSFAECVLVVLERTSLLE